MKINDLIKYPHYIKETWPLIVIPNNLQFRFESSPMESRYDLCLFHKDANEINEPLFGTITSSQCDVAVT